MKFISIALFFRFVESDQGDDIEIWFQKRSEQGPLDGYLEFPGGKIEKGESPRAACLREVSEEVGIEKSEDEDLKKHFAFFKFYPFEYSDRKVLLYVFISSMELQGFKGRGEFISAKLIKNSPEYAAKILPANLQIIDDVLDFLTISNGYRSFDNAWQLLSQSQYFF